MMRTGAAPEMLFYLDFGFGRSVCWMDSCFLLPALRHAERTMSCFITGKTKKMSRNQETLSELVTH